MQPGLSKFTDQVGCRPQNLRHTQADNERKRYCENLKG
jgi:hypothetical protein